MYYYGDFYKLPDGTCCRSTPEIVTTRRTGHQLRNLSRAQPNLVVIMANPGGSEPTVETEWQQRQPGQNGELVDLRETEPDRTQDKVVEVMERRDYDHVRVLNLSDICETSMERLIEELKAREEGDFGDSVFASEDRAEELRERLNPQSGGAIVAAWSYKSAAVFTARGSAAFKTLVQRRLRVVGVGGRFAHPSRNETWPREIDEMLGNA